MAAERSPPRASARRRARRANRSPARRARMRPPAHAERHPADLVLTGGRIHTVDAATPWARGARRPGRPHRRGRRRTRDVGRWIGPRDARHRSRAAGRSCPGFQDAHVHPIHGGHGPAPVRPPRARGRDDVPRASSPAYAAAHPDRSGSSAAAGTWRTSRTARRAARTSTRSSRTGRSSSRTATATTPGSTAGRSSWPGSRRGHAGPGRRPDRARPRRDADRHAPRGRADLVERLHPDRRTDDDSTRACSRARRYLHSLGITAWQDAIVDARRPATLPSRWPSRAS